jgi:hypothetical protein
MLDVNTPLGQDAIKWARRGEKAFLEAHPSVALVETDQDKPADVDGIVYKACEGGFITAVIETKARYYSIEKLTGDYGWEMLINADKLEKGAKLAIALKCNFAVLLVLVPSRLTLALKITGEDGEVIPKVRFEMKKIRATTNGGTALREVAYINMKQARQYKTKSL